METNNAYKPKHKKLISSLMAISMIALTLSANVFATSGADFTISGTTLIAYTGTSTNISIPASVTKINKQVFLSKNLTSVDYPSSLTDIGEQAFQGNRLTDFTAPAALTDIGEYAFNGNQLSSVDISTVKKLGDGAFQDNRISTLKLSETTSAIPSFAFKENELTEISLSSNITSIEEQAFAKNKLTYLEIPSTVKSLGRSCFNNNQLPDHQAFIYSRTNPNTLISYGGARREDVIIPKHTKTIATYAFRDVNVTSLLIPEGVTKIEANAFEGTSIETIVIPKSVTEIERSAFFFTPTKTIYLSGRTDTSDMTLGQQWNGTAKIEFGEPPVTPPAGGAIDGAANVSVSGSVDPITTLDIEVPLSALFMIDGDRHFTSSKLVITNNSTVAVEVTAKSLLAQKGTPAKVVAHDLHTDTEWKNLSKREAQSKIALGLINDDQPDLVKWFNDESSQSDIKLGTVGSASSSDNKMNLKFTAKYGYSWGDLTDLRYDLILSFNIL